MTTLDEVIDLGEVRLKRKAMRLLAIREVRRIMPEAYMIAASLYRIPKP